MKINEFFNNPISQNLDWDVPKDVYTYMINDPEFYRKEYFPAVLNFNKGAKAESLIPVINSACNKYVRKYNINKEPTALLTDEEKRDMSSKIYAREKQRLKKGNYK